MGTSKSFSNETSERYARALFEVANENSETDKTENNIKDFLNLYSSSVEFTNFIKNPTQTNESQSDMVNIIAKKLEFSKNFKNFLFLLIKKKRIFFVNKILQNFLKLCFKKRGEVKASLISSKILSLRLKGIVTAGSRLVWITAMSWIAAPISDLYIATMILSY